MCCSRFETPIIELTTPALNAEQFIRISDLLHRSCGIKLLDGKQALVKARLLKRLLALGLPSFDAYLTLLHADGTGDELRAMVDMLTTNKTSFFREPQHFELLREEIIPKDWRNRSSLRIWSAGCSTGEEPYSLAITMREELPDTAAQDVRILATDVSTRVLERARAGRYEPDVMADVRPPVVRRFFHPVPGAEGFYEVGEAARALVKIARLNLLERWPMRGPFDAVFCRNVMIYFDEPTREGLVGRFFELLRPGGYLFVGGAESLSGIEHPFRYVQPAVFRKDAPA